MSIFQDAFRLFRRSFPERGSGMLVSAFVLLVSFVVGQDAGAQIQPGDFCELSADLELSSREGQLDIEKGDTLEVIQILNNSIEVKAGSTKGLANKKMLQKKCTLFWASCKLKKPIKLYSRKQKRKPRRKRGGTLVVEIREKMWSRVRDGKRLAFVRTAELLQRCTLSQGPTPTPYRPHWPKRNMRKKNIVVLPFAVRGVSDSEVKLVERTFSKAFVKGRKDAVGIPRRSISETERSNSLKRIIEAVKVDANANAPYAVVGLVKPGKGKSWSVTIALVDVAEEKVLKAAKSNAKRNSSRWARKVAGLVASVLPKARRIPPFMPKIPDPPADETSVTSEPGASEPVASEGPAREEPLAMSELAASEPAASEPAASEPAASEPAASEPAASEPAASEPAASAEASAKTALVTTEPASQSALKERSQTAASTEKKPKNVPLTSSPSTGMQPPGKKDAGDCKEERVAPEIEIRVEERWLVEKRPFYINTLAGASFGIAAAFLVAGGTMGTLGVLDMVAVNDMKQSNPMRPATIASMQQKSGVADVFFVSSIASAGAGVVFLLLGVDVDGVKDE